MSLKYELGRVTQWLLVIPLMAGCVGRGCSGAWSGVYVDDNGGLHQLSGGIYQGDPVACSDKQIVNVTKTELGAYATWGEIDPATCKTEGYANLATQVP